MVAFDFDEGFVRDGWAGAVRQSLGLIDIEMACLEGLEFMTEERLHEMK